MALTFPPLLKPVGSLPRFFLENQSRGGGVALNGQEQTISSGAERWRCSGTWRARGRTAILQTERFLLAMDGRSGEADVPTCSGRFANWPVSAQGIVLTPRATRDSRLDGTLFEDPEIPSASAITATLNGAAALRDVEIDVAIVQGGVLSGGQLFSIGSRLYRIRSIEATVGNITTITFRPPLRAAASNGATVEFARPACVMKFSSDDQGIDFNPLLSGSLSLNFVEAY